MSALLGATNRKFATPCGASDVTRGRAGFLGRKSAASSFFSHLDSNLNSLIKNKSHEYCKQSLNVI